MTGNWKINTILGCTGFLFTYLFSIMNNTWQTSLFRAGIGFLLFFLLAYVLRFVLHQTLEKQKIEAIISPQQEGIVAPSKIEINEQSEEVVEDEMEFEAIPLHNLHSGKTSN